VSSTDLERNGARALDILLPEMPELETVSLRKIGSVYPCF
jgi:hypothetical protein